MTVLFAVALVVVGLLWALDRRRLLNALERADEAIHDRDRAAARQMATVREYSKFARDIHDLAVTYARTDPFAQTVVGHCLEFIHQRNEPSEPAEQQGAKR